MRITGALSKAGWGHYTGRIHLPQAQEPDATPAIQATMHAARLREGIELLWTDR